MTLRAALYARYSTDLQSETSAADQLAALRSAAMKRGWREVAAYTDEGISGSALATRPGILALMRDAEDRRFDVVFTEALDRLSRGQADIARLYELLTYRGIRLATLTSDAISEIHIGLEGTMNRLFLIGLADKTRRGLIGRVNAGFSGGGHCYAYDIGDKGVLTINPEKREIVRRIYRDYARGLSTKTIAHALNREGVPGPRGGVWSPTSISGDRRARDGILCQELYVGVRVFNRRRYRKHPVTGRRSSVLNPASDWIRQPAPELRILDDDLWAAVQARQAPVPPGVRPLNRAPKRLLSGLLRCSMCEGPMTLHGGKYACANHRERGTCANGKIIRAPTVENRVLDALKTKLLAPEVIAQAVRDYHAEAEAAAIDGAKARLPIEKELAELARRIDRAADSYERGVFDVDELAARVGPLKARRDELRRSLDALASPPATRLHPKAADYYGTLASNLTDAIAAEDGEEARSLIRSVIERVDFVPVDGLGRFDLTVHGKLAALLGVSERAAAASSCEVRMGAGTGFEPVTFRL